MSKNSTKTTTSANVAVQDPALKDVTFGRIHETYLTVSFFCHYLKDTCRVNFGVERQDELVDGKVSESFFTIQADNCIDEQSVELHLTLDEIKTITAMLHRIVEQ